MINKKGFTLVELLAVVTILAILVLLAIPNVTRYVEESRKKTFVEDAKTIVSTAKSNYASGSYELTNGIDSSKKDKVIYSKIAIDSILSSKLGKSSFNSDYKDAGVIISKTTDIYGATRYNYYVCLIDKAGNGFDYTSDKDLNTNSLSFNQEITNCTGLPRISYTVNVVVNNGSVNESEKKVYEDEDASFNLTPNSSGMESTVSCTNNQKGILNNNTLTVKDVTASTTCTVTFSQSMTVLYNDGTLIINEKPNDRSSNINKHGEIKKEYAGMSNSNQYVFTSYNTGRPWYNEKSDIKNVEIGQEIFPISTAYWFHGCNWMHGGDFYNLNTSQTTNMSFMFYSVGASDVVTDFSLRGINMWDTSNVTDMSYMFYSSGKYTPNYRLDISNWNTSKVTNMSYMFRGVGDRSSSFELDLSKWVVSSLKYATSMFEYAAQNAKTWNIGNISNWDTINLISASYMFEYAGFNAITFEQDLSGWRTPNLKGMGHMFYRAGENSTIFKIDLSSFDTSNVANMDNLFSNAGPLATTWSIGDLSNWDVSNVTSMYEMFYGAGSNATVWSIGDLSNWNTSKVINMNGLFKCAGNNAATWDSIGTLKVYTSHISELFKYSKKAKATLNIYSNPTNYGEAFSNAATASDSLITVNYSSATTNIDNIIATKSNNSNVVKGVQLD